MKFDKKTERRALTIKGHTFQYPTPFKAGHALTENEASVLNQVLGENLRNNFASTVSEAIEAAKKDGKEADLASLQKDFDLYIAEYEFGVRTGGGFVGDPVAREGREIAKTIAKELLKKAGHKLSDVPKETWDATIAKILAHPNYKDKIPAMAKKRVEEKNSLAASGLEIA